MLGILLAFLLSLPQAARAASVQSAAVNPQAGAIPMVPTQLGSPAMAAPVSQALSAAALTSALPGLSAVPQLQVQPALSAEVASALPASAVSAMLANTAGPAAVAAPAAAAAVSPVSPVAPAAQAELQALRSVPAPVSRTILDRLYQAAAKLGFSSLGRTFDNSLTAAPEEAAAQAAEPEKDSGSIGHRKRRGQEEENPNADDGGGARYPRRKIAWRGHDYPSVALRPNILVEDEIVTAIKASRTSIQLALYEFKLRGVLEALVDARKRGVKISIILDYSNVFPSGDPESDYKPRRSPEIWGLLREGFEVNVLRGVTQFGINHNKFAIFDGEMVEFGSYNWSITAEKDHYENALFSQEAARIKGFAGYFDYLKSISAPFAQAKDYAWPKTVPAPPADTGPGVEFNGVQLPSYIFMPNGSAFEEAVVKAIDAARESVDVAQFAIRSTRIAEALARARARDLSVRVIFDESQSESEYFGPYAAWLASQGVEVRTLAGPDPDSNYPMAQKMHHKFMVLDGKLVETGSANWTKRASMDNYENAHFLDEKTDAAAFSFAFSHMFSVARAYPKPAQVPTLPTEEALINDILNPVVKPTPPAPAPVDLPAARQIPFHGVTLPSFALLPYEPIEPLYVKAIDATQKSLRIAIYEFTSEPILAALRRAKTRGVKIEIVLDRNHVYTTGISHTGEPRKPKPQVAALAKEFDLKTLRGKGSGVMHNKFLIFDGQMVSFGSYNLTDVAEHHHFENLKFSNETPRVNNYIRYFDYMRELAEDVDHDKLDEILNRTIENMSSAAKAGEDEESEPVQPEAAGTGRRAKFPPPPEDEARPIKFNGVDFPRQLFSPQGHIEETLVAAVKAAKTSIEIAMFSFYSQAIADALLEMKKANPELAIRLVLDASQSKLAGLDSWFVSHGFEVRLLSGPKGDDGDPMFQKMHNKFIIVDGKLLETGSFNYSPNAENNSFENANFEDDPTDLAGYVAYFARLWDQGWKASAPKKKPAGRPAGARSHDAGSESEPVWSDTRPTPVLAGPVSY